MAKGIVWQSGYVVHTQIPEIIKQSKNLVTHTPYSLNIAIPSTPKKIQ